MEYKYDDLYSSPFRIIYLFIWLISGCSQVWKAENAVYTEML